MTNSDPQSKDSNKRLGKGMIIAAWVGMLGLLTLFFNDVLYRQHNPNQQVKSIVSENNARTVELKRNNFGHYVANGKINGTPVVFLLDTGATDVALSEGLANKLNLRRGSRSIAHTANGEVRTWLTRLDSVTLGDIELKNVRASILPGLNDKEVLLGMSYLKQLELTQRGNTLTIRQIDR